jgi:hypothetical protein
MCKHVPFLIRSYTLMFPRCSVMHLANGPIISKPILSLICDSWRRRTFFLECLTITLIFHSFHFPSKKLMSSLPQRRDYSHIPKLISLYCAYGARDTLSRNLREEGSHMFNGISGMAILVPIVCRK